MFTILVILAVLLQVAIALGVYFRRNGGHNNKIFMFLSLTLACWALANYISITIPQNDTTIFAIRAVITLVVIQNTLFYFFAKTFPNKKLNPMPRVSKLIVIYSAMVVILSQTPYVFSSVTIENGTTSPNPSPPIIFFVIHALLIIALGLISFIRLYKKSIGQQKRQILFILFASTIVMFILPITNFVLTLGLNTTLFVKFSPFYTLAFGGIITYAIVAQKLFDIRAAVARSVTYLFIMGTLTIIYGVLLFGVINVIFQGPDHELLRQVLSVILVTPLVLSFQSIKKFFDRVTNRLFYRDSYDLRHVLDKLGNVVVAEIDLHKILISTRKVLTEALKSSFIEFILFRDDEPYFEAHGRTVPHDSLITISTHIKEQRKELLITDDLPNENLFHKEFSASGVALSLRLKTQDQIVGYILLGDKSGGDLYGTQDKELLMIAANELALTIQNALRFEEIKHFNKTLQVSVNEATNELRVTNKKLRLIDESKDDFISMASHQLRTPLTSIKGYLSMMLEGDIGKITPDQRKVLEEAYDSSQRMVYLIGDFLNVSRLQTGKFEIERSNVKLPTLIADEIDQLRISAQSRHTVLSYTPPEQFPTLRLDENKIRQVMMNFIDNAIYYSKPGGGKITVTLTKHTKHISFKVIDDGIGVPRSEQHQLFSKFYRASNAKKARPDGTGIGLFMAKKVIIAHGGAILFESKEGEGSMFGFRLPIEEVATTKDS